MKNSQTLILFDIDGTILHNTNPFYIYPESLSVIQQLSQKYQIGIFSQGFRQLKFLKLKIHRLWQYFNNANFYVSLNKMSLVQQIIKQHPTSQIIIVDNLSSIVDQLQAYPQITAVLINRSSKQIDKQQQISSLKDLLYYKFKN